MGGSLLRRRVRTGSEGGLGCRMKSEGGGDRVGNEDEAVEGQKVRIGGTFIPEGSKDGM